MTILAVRRERARQRAAARSEAPVRPTALLTYTGATIVAGFGALAAATLTIPVSPRIALPFLGDAGVGGGVVLWVLFGLAGAARIIRNPSGHGVLTFHLPFIVAAMALGGPVAGAWVGMLSTFDRHELEEAPWYGILANHAAFALSAVVGGLVMQGALDAGAPVAATGLSDLVELVAILAGTVVFTVASVAIAVGTIVLRGGLSMPEALQLFNGSYRRTTMAETILGWVLALVYVGVGWWAPIVCAALVLSLWQANADRSRLSEDPLTGLLNRDGFRALLEDATSLASRGGPGGALAFVDLDGFGELNKRIGYQAADEVLVHVADRLRRTIRGTDAAGRLMGDEFAVLYPGVTDGEVASRLAWRLHAALAEPYETSKGTVDSLAASVGIATYAQGATSSSGRDVERRAYERMFSAKRQRSGVELERSAVELERSAVELERPGAA